MKLTFLVLGSGLLLASPAHAQLGVRVGGNATVFTRGARPADSNPATQRQLGYQAGLYYVVPLTKRLALAPEVQFSREYFAVDYTPVAPSGTVFYEGPPQSNYDQALSYFNLPVLLRASLGVFYVEGGPQLSLLAGGRAQSNHRNSGFAGNYNAVDAMATKQYRRFDAGPCVGVGVKLPAGLGLGLRAYWGLTKVSADESQPAFEPTYRGFQHRQSLQASVTYQLPGR